MRYRIWKATESTCRVLDTKTGLKSEVEKFFTSNAVFHVNITGYIKSEADEFKDTGKPDDYFAWIETDDIIVVAEAHLLPDKVYYNPFLNPFFRDRRSNRIIHMARVLIVDGNTLSYEN